MDGEPVLLSSIIFSDDGNRDRFTGKLTLFGLFHHITASRAPFTSLPFYASAFVTNMRAKRSELAARLIIESDNGRVLSSAIGRIEAPEEIPYGRVAEILFRIPPVDFDAFGNHKAIVSINDEVLGFRPLLVVRG